jgi:uncharacterized membrane protein YkoI
MPKRIHFLLLLTAVLVTTGAASVVSAADNGHYLLARRGGGEGGVSLNQAVQQVQRETGGRVLSADTINQGGRAVHRIKVLTPSGQVRVMTIDAQSRGH